MWLIDEVAEKASTGPGLVFGAGVSTITLLGVPLHEWVYILTLIVLAINIGKFVKGLLSKLRRTYGRAG